MKHRRVWESKKFLLRVWTIGREKTRKGAGINPLINNFSGGILC